MAITLGGVEYPRLQDAQVRIVAWMGSVELGELLVDEEAQAVFMDIARMMKIRHVDEVVGFRIFSPGHGRSVRAVFSSDRPEVCVSLRTFWRNTDRPKRVSPTVPRERPSRAPKSVSHVEDPEWRTHAVCAASDLDFFSEDIQTRYQARAMCYVCPVRFECMQDAMDMRERDGIRGGEDAYELRRAQSANSKGFYRHRARGIRCPFCKTKVKDWMRPNALVTCVKCGLIWRLAKKNREQNDRAPVGGQAEERVNESVLGGGTGWEESA